MIRIFASLETHVLPTIFQGQKTFSFKAVFTWNHTTFFGALNGQVYFKILYLIRRYKIDLLGYYFCPPFRRKFCIVIGWFGQTLSGKPITALASTCVLLCLANIVLRIYYITMRLPSSTVCTWKTADNFVPGHLNIEKTKNLPRCYSNISSPFLIFL